MFSFVGISVSFDVTSGKGPTAPCRRRIPVSPRGCLSSLLAFASGMYWGGTLLDAGDDTLLLSTGERVGRCGDQTSATGLPEFLVSRGYSPLSMWSMLHSFCLRV